MGQMRDLWLLDCFESEIWDLTICARTKGEKSVDNGVHKSGCAEIVMIKRESSEYRDTELESDKTRW
jgi:hypothetical protein